MRIISISDLYDLILLALISSSAWLVSSKKRELLATCLGDLTYICRKNSREAARKYLIEAFGAALEPGEMEKIVRNISRQRWMERLCIAPFDFGVAGKEITIEGIEHLRNALAYGKGAILWESPLGRRLGANIVLAERGFSLCKIHGPGHGYSMTWMGTQIISRLRRKLENKIFHEIVEIQPAALSYLKRIVNQLRENRIVCILATGDAGHNFVTVTLLGRQHRFASGALTLARMSGAPLIPSFCYRDHDGVTRLVLEEPLNVAADKYWDKSAASAVGRYAGLLESYVRRYPEQWHWFPSYW